VTLRTEQPTSKLLSFNHTELIKKTEIAVCNFIIQFSHTEGYRLKPVGFGLVYEIKKAAR
jgi:hypothetical protein